jgi:hypothetical protein
MQECCLNRVTKGMGDKCAHLQFSSIKNVIITLHPLWITLNFILNIVLFLYVQNGTTVLWETKVNWNFKLGQNMLVRSQCIKDISGRGPTQNY